MVEINDNDIVLTRRELEVLKLMAKGYTIKETGAKLKIKDTTVIFHRNNLRKIFKARNSIELISKAHRMKIL